MAKNIVKKSILSLILAVKVGLIQESIVLK